MSQTTSPELSQSSSSHRFPWWLAFMLTCPIRRLFDNPTDILDGLVRPGQVVLELGPGNGYYSVAIANALGQDGKLIAVDIEPRMLEFLSRRLKRRNLDRCLVPRICKSVESELSELAGSVDLVVAINVMHELPKPRETLLALAQVLNRHGQLLLIEPRGHVSRAAFETELHWASEAGLRPVRTRDGSQSRRLEALLEKPIVSVNSELRG